MKSMSRGLKGRLTARERVSPSALVSLAPFVGALAGDGRGGLSLETAPQQHVTGAQPQRLGWRCVPPPPPAIWPSGEESGRERPPSLARNMAPRACGEGRSRPDSEPRSSGSFWPNPRPVHDPLALPIPCHRRVASLHPRLATSVTTVLLEGLGHVVDQAPHTRQALRQASD